MSEEILKALTQLFAIISKQDGGVTEGERSFVIRYFQQELDSRTVSEYLQLYDKVAEYGEYAKKEEEEPEEEEEENDEEDTEAVKRRKRRKRKKRGTSVSDSVKILGICKKINKTLTQQQKVIVLFKLLEMLAADNEFTPQRMEIIDTVSRVFNIPKEEYAIVESFVKASSSYEIIDHEDILVFDEETPPEGSRRKYIDSQLLDGEIIFARVPSVGLYFTKYTGQDEIFLNGQLFKKNVVTLFSHGSVFRTPRGKPLYYSDLVATYNADSTATKLSFNVKDLEFRFPNGHVGLRNINISENAGKLIGIMGASGAGKTTLLNVMAGLEVPSSGSVTINGFNIHTEKERIEGVIGYVAQDDLLMEDLTVYQNLYYNAKLCFDNFTDEEVNKKVDGVLMSLGLHHIKHLKVGSPLNKKISGGQRKRLNIALELIREPSVLFVDEPTSGLSSRDSENVIDLLKELSLKGKLIFVVIHQPSSDIYKMFDKMYIMDTGGYPVYYGNPVAAVTYFKQATNQVGSDSGQCNTCGNVNVELIFNLIEARVVDEYGEFTPVRKITPDEWHERYKKNHDIQEVQEVMDAPEATFQIPPRHKQTLIFTIRDFLSKVSNTQYMVINLLEAPVLALFLSVVVRYYNGPEGQYIFRFNDNIPAYILISVIVSLFMGLSVSAEEIIRDRKIQRRESFLNLSRTSYLFSKLLILFTLSAIQALSFVLIGNLVLEIKGMFFAYWGILFSISCFANVLGLNISASFSSAVAVYILIPILLIPQMILSGAIFRFDQMHAAISEKGHVPILADIFASRWAYEALMVEQFKGNDYQKVFYLQDLKKSQANYQRSHWIPEIERLIDRVSEYRESPSDSVKRVLESDVRLISNELKKLELIKKDLHFEELTDIVNQALSLDLTLESFDQETAMYLRDLLSQIRDFYNGEFNRSEEFVDSIKYAIEMNPEMLSVKELEDLYHSEKVADAVRNNFLGVEYIVRKDDHLVQLMDPIFHVIDPAEKSFFDFRAQFFVPYKHFAGQLYQTYYFNVAMIWLMTILLYFTLYFESLKRLLHWFSEAKFVQKATSKKGE
ncbi:MAG: ATP-binding cassette domain-containing protein [Bernardetiaceae bacterium]